MKEIRGGIVGLAWKQICTPALCGLACGEGKIACCSGFFQVRAYQKGQVLRSNSLLLALFAVRSLLLHPSKALVELDPRQSRAGATGLTRADFFRDRVEAALTVPFLQLLYFNLCFQHPNPQCMLLLIQSTTLNIRDFPNSGNPSLVLSFL